MGRRYARVIIDISHEKVDRPFCYKVPETLVHEIEVGSCVEVPFGKGNTLRKGYVIELMEQPYSITSPIFLMVLSLISIEKSNFLLRDIFLNASSQSSIFRISSTEPTSFLIYSWKYGNAFAEP